MTSIRIGVANVQHTDTLAQIRSTITEVAVLVSYLILNEANARAFTILRELAKKGWAFWIPTGGAAANPHLWRTGDVTVLGKPSVEQLQRGGRVGLTYARVSARVKARYQGQRLGPARFGTAQRIQAHQDPDALLMLFGLHMMAKVYSAHGWRLPVYLAARMVFIVWSSRLHRKFPDVPQIALGDWNSDKQQLGKSWRRVTLPADYGRLHYTHCYVRDPKGKLASVKFLREIDTESDHDAEIIEVTWKAAA